MDVRIIAASNKDLHAEVERKAFRLDLLYRLNVFTIVLPPLRDARRHTASHRALHREIQRTHGAFRFDVTRAAMDSLAAYTWPGNVRDLENAVQSAMIVAGTEHRHRGPAHAGEGIFRWRRDGANGGREP